MDDRLVAAIRSPAVPVDSQTDTEDENDCFLATPQTRREAKQALLAKCKGEQEKQVDRLISQPPFYHDVCLKGNPWSSGSDV